MFLITRFFILLSLFSCSAFAFPGGAGPTPIRHPAWSFQGAREIPLQGGGRVKPLDSFAREISLFLTGSRAFDGWDPVDMIFSMISLPEAWQDARFIQVSREDVRRQLGLDEKRSRFSPRELMGNPVLGQYAQFGMPGGNSARQASAPIENKTKADPREQEFKRVFDRIGVFSRVISGESWTVVPSRGANVQAPWASLAEPGADGIVIRDAFVELIRAYQKSEMSHFNSAAEKARAAVEAQVPNWTEALRSRVDIEARYNHWRLFLWAWVIYLIAALIWIVARWRSEKHWNTVALGVTGVAFLIQAAGIAMRCYAAGRPPVTNMYESIIWVSIGQMFFAAILYAIHRQAIVMLVACVLAALGLIAADAAPAVMDPGLHPLVPVLRSNYWLTIHVLTITLGYAAFALTLGLANISLYHFLKADQSGAKTKIASMNQLTYRAMQFGVVLLAAGTILGGVWADYSWGRFWGWDPKEVWALIALLCYLVILHGRFAGWVGQFGFAAWSVLSFLSVMMAWYGVNFVLGAGLHSYGFSSGGGMAWIMGFIALQLVYVLGVTFSYKRKA